MSSRYYNSTALIHLYRTLILCMFTKQPNENTNTTQHNNLNATKRFANDVIELHANSRRELC